MATVVVSDLAEPNAAGLQVDVLINNAGFGGHGKFHERELAKDQTMMPPSPSSFRFRRRSTKAVALDNTHHDRPIGHRRQLMLKLHFAPNSRAGRIVWLFEELGIDYEINKMAFHPKDLKSDEHRARHPLGRIPVLEDGDLTLWESGAIIEYVMARYGDGGLKPAVDSAAFPEYLQWFHYCEGMVMPPINTIMVHSVLLPPDRRDEKVLAQAQRLLGRSVEPVDNALTGREYLVGDFSAADIMLGHALFMANRLGQVSDELTNLKSYTSRIEKRPAFQKAITMQ